jgi:hypothetical protein
MTMPHHAQLLCAMPHGIGVSIASHRREVPHHAHLKAILQPLLSPIVEVLHGSVPRSAGIMRS